MDRFEELRTFVRIADAGSLGRAAERLNLAKSAVSRRLKDLEDRLGVRLVNRSPRALGLTDTGRAFHERAVRLLADLDEAEDAAAAAGAPPGAGKPLRGTVRVTAPLSFGVRHLAPVLNDFLAAHPGVSIDLDLNDRRADLVEEGLDLAVRAGGLEPSQLVARRLLSFRRLACASPDYLARHGAPRRPEDLRDAGHVGLVSANLPEGAYWTFLDAAGGSVVARPAARLRASNGDAVAAAAVRGLGICAVPTFITHADLAAGRLVPVLPGYALRPEPLHAVYPPGRHLSPRVRALVDHVAARLGGDPPPWERAEPAA